MKSPALNIIIGAASIAVAVWFLQKYFAENNKMAGSESVTADLLQDDREATKDCQPGIFPDGMLVEMDDNQVDNWANFSDRRHMQYKYQNPPAND